MQITIREPGSAITHFIGMMMAVFAAIPLLVKSSAAPDSHCMAAMTVFMISMVLLYGASATYHSLNMSERVIRVFRKIDHMMIFVLIAGTYTPICVLVLGGKEGMYLLALIWGIALGGMVLKAFWVTCPRWFSSILYIAMGWVCILVFPLLLDKLSPAAFTWLFAGGILYTVGGVVYALKLKGFNSIHKYFGSHEIFHLFVMAGSFCHFVVMYKIL